MAMGIALVYCDRGSLVLAELLSPTPTSALSPLYLAGVGLVLAGLAFKLSFVPAHLWTPDVYQGAPAPVTALLSTASKAAAAVALLLLFPLLRSWQGARDLFWILALLSMLAGNLAALRQTGIKRMLGWSSIAQMGYVALAFVAYPSGGGRAALFYIAAYVLAGLASFGAVAVLSGESGSDELDQYRGVGYRHPLAGAALAVAMFSLAGIPPTAGFMAKFAVFSAALRGGEHALALIGILSALVAVFFYLRIVVILYMKPAQGVMDDVRPLEISDRLALLIPLIALLWLGVFPSALLDVIAGILP
jgi:NADH-quinone oxidoreductase subunit N